MISILIASLIFFSIIAILRLDLAVLFIIALLPSYLIRFAVLGVPMTFLEAMILISFALWFFQKVAPNLKTWLKNRNTRVAYPFGLEIIALIIISFIAVGISGFSFGAMGIWKAYFFEPILLFILILNILPGQVGRKKIINALLIGAGGTILVALFQQATGLFIFNKFWADIETRRVVSWFGYPNAVGLFLAPLTMIFIGWGLTIKNTKNNYYILKSSALLLIILLSLMAIYFAKSEGALIGLLAGIFFFCFFSRKIMRLIVGGGAILAIIIIISIPSLKAYATDKVFLNDLSGEIRQRQWKETMMTLKGWRFITGNGLDNYQTAVKPYHQEGIFFNSNKLEDFDNQLRASAELRAKYWQPVEIYMYPHNIFLNFWSELGLLGLLIFTWLIGKYILLSLKLFYTIQTREKYIALGLFGAMIAILIHGLVDVPYFKNDLSAMFFILLALLSSLIIDTKNQNI